MSIADDLLGLVLAFEVYAAISKRFPLISTMARQHRWIIVPVVVPAVVHLWRRAADA